MNDIGLYLHVPFCRQKCAYCDFYSVTDTHFTKPYLDALCRAFSAFPTALARKADTVYLGGGTPSLLPPDQVGRLFFALRRSFAIKDDAEISMEMNPESASSDLLSAAVRAGVNRVSFGMQSCVPEELARIGRIHDFQTVQEAVLRAKCAGIENINLDLMYGLPAQTPASFRKSLEAAVSLGVQHISFYALTLSPDVPLYRQKDTLCGEDAVSDLYFLALRFLRENGFEQYEISNAALPGYACRHNVNTWKGGEYLGFGPGAHSYWENRRFSFPRDLHRFLSAKDHAGLIVLHEVIGEEERLKEYIMLSLRLAEGISLQKAEALGGQKKRDKIERYLTALIPAGLARRTNDGFRLTPEGFFVSNAILADLI